MPQATQTVMEKWSHIPCNCRASSWVCKSFEKLIKTCELAIYGNACLTRIEPKFELVTLNASGRQTTVVWFEFLAKVHDILMCPHSHDASNYIFDFSKENPFDLDVKNNEYFGDIHETVWFRLTYNKMVSNPLVETLVPLMIYIDRINTDSYGRLCLEPVTFTLSSIGNTDLRRRHGEFLVTYLILIQCMVQKLSNQEQKQTIIIRFLTLFSNQ